MTPAPPNPKPIPKPIRHVQIFAIGTLVVLTLLLLILFIVRIEATIPAMGTLETEAITTISAPIDGIWNPTEPIWKPGEMRTPTTQIGRIGEREIHLPSLATGQTWQLLKPLVAPGIAVESGWQLAKIVPTEIATQNISGLRLHLKIDEKHAGDLAVGQGLRFACPLYPTRVYGMGQGTIESVEPIVSEVEGSRFVRAIAHVESAPFPLRIGASVTAQIVIGDRITYRVILDH